MSSADRQTGVSLRWRICLLTGTIVWVSLTSLGLITFIVSRQTVIDLKLETLLAQTRDAASSVERILAVSRADAINVPGFPPIPGIIRTLDSGQADPDGSTQQIWVERLRQILEAQMKTYSERLSCAVVDARGKELMRVERTNNSFYLAAPDQLRNVANEEYFLEAVKRSREQAYVSPIGLDADRQPILYVATPYVEGNPERVRAVFVIKLDGKALTEAADASITEGSTDIVNQDGLFLYSDDTKNRILDPTCPYGEDFPERAERMRNTAPEADEYSAYIPDRTRPGPAVVGIYRKVHFNPSDRKRFWAIAPSIPASQALDPVTRLARLFFIVGLLVLLVGVIVTFFASSGLTHAIRQLALAADRIAAGELNTELPAERRYGEVGALTSSLNTMTTNLRDTIAHLSAQEARTNAVLSSTADALITIDARGIIQTFNSSAEELFGYRSPDVIGQNVSILAPSPHREEHNNYLYRYERTGEAHIIGKERELEGVRKDGTIFPLSLRVTEVSHNDEKVFIGTVQDITKRKEVERDRSTVATAVRDAVNRLAAASHQILATTAEQAAGTQQQAAAVTESVATAEQLAQTADQAAARADAVAEAARRSEEVGTAGSEAVGRSVTAMQEVKEQVESIAESILALAERAQAIGEITAAVREIAEQTNVLALNAAVEASRAGEHGKGFAVVAGEVKSLAEQSKKATGQVRQILEEIQQATNDAVLSTEAGTRAVIAAEEVVRQAGDTIGSLSQTLADSARSAVQISATANQQASGVVQLNQGMKRINQVTKQHAAATQEIEQAAKNLNALSNELASLTSLGEVD